MNRSILISAKVVVLILSFPLLLVTYAQEQTQVQECELGENREFAIGHNFWKAMVGKEKTLSEINSVAGIWLGCAATDIKTNHIDSAKVRLLEVLKVLNERKGDPLIIASAQFRLAHVLLHEQRWSEAVTYANRATKKFENHLASSGQPRRWLDWGGYDERQVEILLALHVLARAYKANHDPKWRSAIDKAIATAERTVGRNSTLYKSSVRLKKDLAGGQSLNLSASGERLIEAIIRGDSSKAKQLATVNAVVNHKDHYGMTPLHFAASRGRLSIARLLIERGTNINAIDKNGVTPLRIAADENHKEVADLLIAEGAHMSIHIAAALGRTDDLKSTILRGDSIDARDSQLRTPLYVASRNCHLDAAMILIQRQANVNARSKYDWTPLHTACSNGCPSVAKLLIEHGADVNARTLDLRPLVSWNTPLHLAVSNCKYKYIDPSVMAGKTAIVELLIKYGAKVNQINSSGATPLHEAAHRGCVDILKLLIHNGANVNIKDLLGETPLDDASPDALEILIR